MPNKQLFRTLNFARFYAATSKTHAQHIGPPYLYLKAKQDVKTIAAWGTFLLVALGWPSVIYYSRRR
ncbi:hypothetical protein KAFR_0B05440 [Kazachstania africana CBS 2517]|uniref:Uncharacterized protein n=1 Tax=Kazachstania africana (strain ATCC 22294 / BCRC 22015 / CBS 2517 / CECT 1963 / NBRC 1671 / NRRL Y-8276) TaxID=1071382 RepID=H2AR39_KAZAF|nr:hypothetical protein KAFR_0B05440 [Kazachstania africana CBS 2517]CCF56839.1 hypothetical protein KAFR_0B05440 [Kazachstania africana CBS 2517]